MIGWCVGWKGRSDWFEWFATENGIKGTLLIGRPLKDERAEGGFTIALRDWDDLLEKKERADGDWSTWFVVWANVDSSQN